MRTSTLCAVCAALLIAAAVGVTGCGSAGGGGDGDGSGGTALPPLTAMKFNASDAEADDEFATSLSISGDYFIAGAPNDDGTAGNPMADAGAAYIFHRTGVDTWDAGTKIVAPDAQADDVFGFAVSISGDYAVVGARYEDGGDLDPLNAAGAAYIFHRTGVDTWDTGTKIVAPDAEPDDYFGRSVSISGDYVIVGATYKDGGAGNPYSNAGAAYIFHRTGTNTWDAGTRIEAYDAWDGDYFGYSVSISGDYAVAGAYGKNKGVADCGAAYIFHRTGTNTWDAGTKIDASDAEYHDFFGRAVSICGDYVVAGAYEKDDQYNNIGAAYVFYRTGTNDWDAGTKIVAPDAEGDDWFGYSVSISGASLIVGAIGEDGDAGNPLNRAGAAYLFE